MGSSGAAMAECTGKYRLATSENFEEFMKVLGVGLITRKLGNKTSPTVTITKEGDEYNFRQDSIKTSEFKFKVDVPFEEITADGRKVISTMSQLAPNKMRHEMKGTDGGKDSVCEGVLCRQAHSCVPVRRGGNHQSLPCCALKGIKHDFLICSFVIFWQH